MDAMVLGIAEARKGLPALVDRMATGRVDAVIIGSHRKPEAALIPYATFVELTRGAGHPPTGSLAFVKARAELIGRIASVWGLHSIAVFGSVARGEEGPESDIDLLVDAEPGRTYFDIAGFELDLEQVLGRPVHVLTRDALDPHRKRDKAMLDDAVLL